MTCAYSTREAIVAEARAWIGTPYRHQASLKGIGCDCLGLVRGVWRNCIGDEPEVPPPYASDWAEAKGDETLAAAALRHLVPVAHDGFLIGSELRSLTRVRSGAGIYPAVDALVALAADVKSIVGSSTIVTYGADWTEYGADVVDAGASEVRFPLDPLWACSAIDAVGIDYYAPLADWRDEAGHLDASVAASTYDLDYLAENVYGGEGFDWYYTDDSARAAQNRTPITDGLGKPWTFRVKDIKSWWSSAHYERVGGVELPSPTAWAPQSKPVWLTEVGCPAVDKGANQPNVFPDPKSSENHLPYFSSGSRDDLVQRRYLQAFLGKLDPSLGAADADNPVSPIYGSRMIEPSAIHLWTWDARPYPAFPAATEVWSDGPNWQTGHWLTGRLGAARELRRLRGRPADVAARHDRTACRGLRLRCVCGRRNAALRFAGRRAGCGIFG